MQVTIVEWTSHINDKSNLYFSLFTFSFSLQLSTKCSVDITFSLASRYRGDPYQDLQPLLQPEQERDGTPSCSRQSHQG